MNIKKSKVVLGTLLVLALGVFAGAFGANIYFKHRIEQFFSKSDPPPVVHLFMKRLSNKLDLTDTQRREIEEIVRQSHRELREVRSKFRPEIEAIMNSAFADIEEKLDEEQQQKLNEFRERFSFSHGRKRAYGTRSPKPRDRISRRFLAEVDQKLTLTENQLSQIHEIVDKHLAAMRELFKDAGSGGEAESGKLQVALDRLNRQTEGALETLLTEEQLITYKQIWNEQRQELWGEMSRQRKGRMDE